MPIVARPRCVSIVGVCRCDCDGPYLGRESCFEGEDLDRHFSTTVAYYHLTTSKLSEQDGRRRGQVRGEQAAEEADEQVREQEGQ